MKKVSFPKKLGSENFIFKTLTPLKKSEKSTEPILRDLCGRGRTNGRTEFIVPFQKFNN